MANEGAKPGTEYQSKGTATIFESPKLRVEMDVLAEDSIALRPIGIIDEDCNMAVIINGVLGAGKKVSKIHFDLGGISRMNSCGVREWIGFIARLQAAAKLSFGNVRELIMEQAGMVKGVLGGANGNVISLQLPYHCKSCNERIAKLVQRAELRDNGGTITPPEAKCARCGDELEFDALPEQYFEFFNR